jgi:hypothetical protein
VRFGGLIVLAFAPFAFACGRDAVPQVGDGLDVSSLPPDVQRDYAVFANRCSKCHALSRPLALAAREDSDEYWARYVEKMRRQPESGISASDGVIVRRFLHFYSHAEKLRRDPDAGAPPAIPLAPDTTLDGGQP